MFNDNLYDEALHYAKYLHQGQVRKYTGEPYVNHCIAVATKVSRYISDPEIVAAALLHDTVEDCSGYPHGNVEDLIRKKFGDNVSKYVWFLTKTPEFVGTREERKRLDTLRLALAPLPVIFIKLCDVMHNSTDIRNLDPDFWKTFRVESKMLAYATRFATVAGMYGDDDFVVEYSHWWDSLEDR